MSEKIIGIDLGTTNSLAAAIFDTGPEVIYQLGDSPLIPSVLTYTNHQWDVGEQSKNNRVLFPERTVYSVKRLIGRDITELEEEIKKLPYQVVAGQRKLVKVRLGDQEFTPQELSAEILKKVKEKAEKALGESIHKAVITVPAYFDDAQRQATRDAARLIGIEAVRIMNEPTAAAIAYGLDEKKEGNIAIYDLGGGTFDISILQLSGKIFKVLSTHGDTQLGGDDFDQVLIGQLKDKLLSQYPTISFENPALTQTLKQVAEEIKIELSGAYEASFHLQLAEEEIDVRGIIQREEFEKAILSMIHATLESCRIALANASLSVDEITEVVLVGGSTRIPSVRKEVETFFQKKPHVAIDPYKVVAIGAAIQGHLLAGGRRDFLLLDVIPLALGIETLGGTFSKLIMSNTTIPSSASELFTTHVDDQNAIEINIYQGERELVKDCRSLGKFKLRGIPPMKAGLPLVEVTFEVDANGILNVTALEKRSGQVATIEIVPFHGLTNQEIDQIMEDSFEHAIEDFQERQLIEFRNQLTAIKKGIQENWEEAQTILTAEQLASIQSQIQLTEQSAKENDPQILKKNIDVLGEMTRILADTAISRAVFRELSTPDE